MDKACKVCRFVSRGSPKCPNCGSEKLTDRWSGLLYIVNSETSEIAKRIGVKMPGKYAAKIKE